MADLVAECGFLKIAEKAQISALSGAMQKRSLMYTSTDIVQGIHQRPFLHSSA